MADRQSLMNLPNRGEVDAFLDRLRSQREHLLTLAKAAEPGQANELAAAIDELGEQLLVADEELRVQSEQLVQSAEELDLLVAAHDELFAGADTPRIQSDADGLVLQMNCAARHLLGVAETMERSITMTSLVRAEDRAAVRDMISSIRTLRPYAAGEELVEASVRTRHGADQPVLVSVRRSRDGSAQRPTLYWELRVPGASPTSTPSATATQGAEPASTAVAFATALADAVAEFARTESPTKLLESVVTAAARIVTPAAAVGGLLVRSRGRIEMISGTGTVAATCDRLQGTAESGPALEAASLAMPVVVDDLRTDERWPEFGFRASQAGVGSMLAVPMTGPRGVFGALTFYATDPQAFSAEFVALAAAYGTHAGMAVGHAELEANLRVGLETREEIGRAVGIIMERHRLNPTGAFDLLVFASQRAHMKLRDVAAWVNETGEDPENLILVRSRGHN